MLTVLRIGTLRETIDASKPIHFTLLCTTNTHYLFVVFLAGHCDIIF